MDFCTFAEGKCALKMGLRTEKRTKGTEQIKVEMILKCINHIFR